MSLMDEAFSTVEAAMDALARQNEEYRKLYAAVTTNPSTLGAFSDQCSVTVTCAGNNIVAGMKFADFMEAAKNEDFIKSLAAQQLKTRAVQIQENWQLIAQNAAQVVEHVSKNIPA